jgi:hypothetical protein
MPLVLALGMPRILEEDGYKFFFYSNEHRPIHVHVRYASAVKQSSISSLESSWERLKD